jgi:hypothetical protein
MYREDREGRSAAAGASGGETLEAVMNSIRNGLGMRET